MYSARRCPQAASSLCGVGVRRSFSDGEVMAHPPYGSAQKERIRFALYCAAVILRCFLCQNANRLFADVCETEKGVKALRCVYCLISLKSEDCPHQFGL